MNFKYTPQKGLIINSGHIYKLLNGTGSWELRANISLKNEPVALIDSGISQIVGVANLIAVKGSVDYSTRRNNVNEHRIANECLQAGRFDNWDVIWTLDQAQRLATQIAVYRPNEGAIWINLDDQVQAQLALALAFIDRGQV